MPVINIEREEQENFQKSWYSAETGCNYSTDILISKPSTFASEKESHYYTHK